MRWEIIQMRWPQYRQLARRRWLALSDAQLDSICGLKELLAQNLRMSYGVSRETAEREIDSWTATFEEDEPAPGEEEFGAAGTAPAQALKMVLEQRRRSDPRR